MRRSLWAIFAACAVSTFLTLPAGAQTPAPPAPATTAPAATLPDREIVVGIKTAAPFAMKGADGNWAGLSVELWQHVADQLHLRYRFVDAGTVQAQIDGAAAGQFDAATAAITVTDQRERLVDFTQPFYTTGLGIAVPINGGPSWLPILMTMTSFGFVQAVLILIGIALAVGILIWIFERKHNDDFGGGAAKGLSSSFWWSANAMTQASTGDFGPRTLPGRILAIIWMVASIIAIAIFTAGVTSVLTTKQLQGLVHGESDLAMVRVGAVTGSSTEGYLEGERIRHRGFATADDGLRALQSGTIDAFVYDRPLLAWTVLQSFSSTIEVLDATFDDQSYAIALPFGSLLRKPINIALLDALESDWWKQAQFRYFGDK